MTRNILSLSDFATLRYSAGGHPLTKNGSQRLGAMLAWLGLRAGASPSAVTLLGLGTFLVAAIGYAWLPATSTAMLACLALMQLAYGLDCADGQLARATGSTSMWGAWFDVACDYARTIALAAGAQAWLVACNLPFSLAVISTSLFLIGAAVHIHTASTLRGATGSDELRLRGIRQHVRRAITVLIDTATVLLLIGLLRLAPTLLATYLAGMGLLYLAISVYLARARLSAAR